MNIIPKTQAACQQKNSEALKSDAGWVLSIVGNLEAASLFGPSAKMHQKRRISAAFQVQKQLS